MAEASRMGLANPLASLEWEAVSCHLCGAAEGEPIQLCGQPLATGQFGYEIHPVLCGCGLVYLNPRWTAATYTDYYTRAYDDLYRLETKPDYGIAGVRRNMVEVWERIRPRLPDTARVRNVLDAGCGSGHGLAYLGEQLPGARLCGIEASPECCRTLTGEVGAELLDSDVDGPWVGRNQGRFELVVMRHVVEHFLTPVETLGRLRSTLAPGGFLYIAVPDMMHPRTVLRDYDQWWEYWFRAVHPYYYGRETLFATLALAGLKPVAWGEEQEEVWCLATAGAMPEELRPELRVEQRRLLERLLPNEE